MSNELMSTDDTELKVPTGDQSPAASDPAQGSDTGSEKGQTDDADTGAREDGSTQDAADDDAKSEDKAPKAPSRAKQRINDLTRDKRNLQRQVSRLNQKIGKLQAEKPPSRDDYPDDASYNVAVMEQAARRSSIRSEHEGTQDAVQSLQVARKETWDAMVEEGKVELPDFDQVFSDDLPITDQMADFLTDTEVGVRIGYFLGKNRSLCARIAMLSDPKSPDYNPRAADRELARIEARMSGGTGKAVSTAPKPVSTVGGKASGVAIKPLGEESYENYVKRRQQMGR